MTGFLEQQRAPLTPEVLAILEDGGFDAEAFAGLDLGIGTLPTNGRALAVPFFDGPEIRSLKVLDAKTGLTLKHLCPTPLPYNINAVNAPEFAKEPLIVVDSEVACWAVMLAGHRRAIAVPSERGAMPLGELLKWEATWATASEIVIGTYDDDAGRAQREILATMFGRSRCKWVRYPGGCASLLEVIRKHGVKGVSDVVAGAAWLALPEVYALSELPEPPSNQSFDTRIVGLGDHYRLRRGDLCVVSGVPSAGKSSLANEIASRMAQTHRWRTIFASFEQRPKPDHRRVLRTFHAGKLEKHLTTDERAKADAWIDQHFRFVVPFEDTETNLDWLLDRLAAAVVRFGADLVVIDPWNELEHQRTRDMTQTEYTGVAIRALKRFAKVHQVHLMIVAHPAKMMRGRDGKYPKPTLYDIADSAHWANKPDVGILIWRDSPEAGKPTQIVVAKSRYHSEIGRPGMIEGIWNEETGRYTITDDGGMEKAA